MRLHVARRTHGQSRSWMAQQLGVDGEHLAAIERGEAPAGVSLIYAAAKALEVPAIDLLPARPRTNDICPNQVADFLGSYVGLEIAELASQLSDVSRARLLTLVEVMVAQERPAAA